MAAKKDLYLVKKPVAQRAQKMVDKMVEMTAATMVVKLGIDLADMKAEKTVQRKVDMLVDKKGN